MVRAAFVCILAVVLAGPAGAVDFYFNGYGGFTNPGQGLNPETPSASFGSEFSYEVPNDFDDDVAASQLFRWGEPVGDQSSYITINERPHQIPEVFDERITDVVTVGDPLGTLAMRLQHHNFPIRLVMEEADPVAIHYHIDIFETRSDAENVVNALFQSGPRDITLEVWETENDAPCPNPSDASTCDDRLEYGFGWLSDSVGEGLSEELGSFEFGGVKYDVIFTGLFDQEDGSLSPTFWSKENGIRTAYASVSIVPEPASAGLVALGLLGLATATRRRR